jgi:hypothetical protein
VITGSVKRSASISESPQRATVVLGHGTATGVEAADLEYPPFPNSNNGGFCANTDPIFDWTYALGRGGRTLTLHPQGQDPCGDRAAILEGTWTRVS